MPPTDQGEAMPTEIVWLPGSTPDLSEREQLLVRNAHADGYAEGERYGYRIGGQDAVRAMTTLSTLLNDRRVIDAFETLHYFITREREAHG